MSKKFIYFVLSAMVVVGLSSCKKGENDPFLSLKSRKARISGQWKLVSGSEVSSTTSNGVGSTSTTTYTETTATTNSTSYQYSETMTIEKDGTFTIEVVSDGDLYTLSGNWFFAGKVKDQDIKNKESIVLTFLHYSDLNYSETYSGFIDGQVYMIDQLKNKEMIFKGEYSSSGSGFTSSDSYERTFEKQ